MLDRSGKKCSTMSLQGIVVGFFGIFLWMAPGVFARNAHDDIIDYVQGIPGGATWEAGHTSLTDFDMDVLTSLSGSHVPPAEAIKEQPHKALASSQTRLALPPFFDARLAWPTCQSIKDIRDQGMCGSCWAQAGASVLSDRICITSPSQTTYVQLSVQDLLVCTGGTSNFCNGAYVDIPYGAFVNNGIVTGGGYQSTSGCMPYSSYTTAQSAATNSTSCTGTCTNPSFQNAYLQDKYFGTAYYGMGNLFTSGATGGAAATVKNESVIRQVQYELLTNGPLTAVMQVYQDFYSYRTGVYQQLTGSYVGGHAIRLIGWGTDNGTDYWLLANSWGTGWGINGIFKILRGTNHMNIEDYFITGTPRSYVPTTTTTTTTTTTMPMTTPPVLGRPQPYSRCDKLFCNQKPAGDYYITPCSTNYCTCDGKGGFTWRFCPAGQYYDKTSLSCKSSGSAFCPPKPVLPLSTTPWTKPSVTMSNMCNKANCNGRGGQYTWFGLALCSPYWCYCWTDRDPIEFAVQTCPTGMLFDFRTESAKCDTPDKLLWC